MLSEKRPLDIQDSLDTKSIDQVYWCDHPALADLTTATSPSLPSLKSRSAMGMPLAELQVYYEFILLNTGCTNPPVLAASEEPHRRFAGASRA
jgi:hypothetical protein